MSISTRNRGTGRSGGLFTLETRRAVWWKGTPISGHAPSEWRRDVCGAVMRWSAYGMTDQQCGWEVDHIRPIAKGGGDELANLQPLQWSNNRAKSDDWPNFTCQVKG